MIDIEIKNSELIRTRLQVAETIIYAISEVRKYKTQNKLAANAPVDEIRLSSDSNISILDFVFDKCF